ncbi:MAG: hypothetical protein CMB97_00995 [Flavobacteriaceae bacterium]|nr:hypothetical protein [Flavobacteriaceae bacterium]
MKKFIDLTSEESKGLDKPLFENALRLKEDSELLATTKNSFSIATSLLILSSEEMVKAILVLLHSEGYKVYKLEEASKFFKDHKIRHQIWQLIETGYELFEAKENWNSAKLNFKSDKKNVTDSLLKNLYAVCMAYKPLSNLKKRVEDIQDFNDLKNKGLYVDFRDGLVIPSESVNEKEYNLVVPITERLFKFYKGIEKLFRATIEANHISIAESQKQKEDLKLLIDTALEDFSFKKLN